jgi:uncharacterized protein
MMVGTAGVLAVANGYGRYAEPQWIQLEEHILQVKNLPAKLAGTRFAQISDVHVGAYFTPERFAQAIDQVNRLGVALLMLTGDYVTTGERNRAARNASRTQAAATLVEPLRQAQVPLYAAMGNHDLWGGDEVILNALAEGGAKVLRNSATQVADGLWLAGVDDVWSGQPDLAAALRDVPAGTVNLLMAHEPDYFDTVLGLDAPIAAQFSGHSHGGQIRYPIPYPGPDGTYSRAFMVPEYSERYPIGLRHKQDRYVYTNRGLGSWPIPYRINCPPEITIFELQEA